MRFIIALFFKFEKNAYDLSDQYLIHLQTFQSFQSICFIMYNYLNNDFLDNHCNQNNFLT